MAKNIKNLPRTMIKCTKLRHYFYTLLAFSFCAITNLLIIQLPFNGAI